ncbi:MAG: flagellar protein FlgN [Clostridium sulfidigenes]|uniref:Flagellar protein FlgN n=1 Tax=Clostridium sulfidigenes TaxID=318464 RepID=A0A927ZLF5_9CLOT|nr:flagellar protein FlgN [Clostridium sulfidigenes]
MKNQLKGILEEELKAIKALIDILEAQHELLVLQDVFKLEAITKDIDDCSRNLARAEGLRRSLTGKESIKKIVEEVDKKEITHIYDEMVKAINALVIQKETNELLIKQSLSYTNSMLAMISPKKEPVVYNGYGKIKR